MNRRERRPPGWIQVVAVLIPILGCLTAMVMVHRWFPGLPGTLGFETDPDNLTQVVVPGSQEITFTEAGAYGVYYEYRSVVNGVVYAASKTPPALACRLTSRDTGDDIQVAPDYVPTNCYSVNDRERVGALIGSITMDRPGAYIFSCQYAHGGSEPDVVVAVGPNFVWEFFDIAAKTIVTATAGVAVLVGSGILAAVILIVAVARRRRGSGVAMAACLMVAAATLSGCMPAQAQGARRTVAPGACCDSPFQGCTIFTVSRGDRVFFGGNGDWINFESNYYWVDPGSDRRYGAIYFGVPDNVQQGFNEKGLAYDANGLPRVPVHTHPGRKPIYRGHSSSFIQILRECATVEEVVAWVREHRWHQSMHYQMHFADATGHAVVISAGPDGQLAFTRKPEGDGFLVSTNFNLANRLNGSYPCWRYDRAEALLREMEIKDELTAERAASVLDAVHVASPSSFTILSLVGDLPQGLVYVYLFHQFDVPIVLNVADEIARAPDPGPLRDLFPPATVSRVDRAYERLMARSVRCNRLGTVWLGLVAVSLVALLLLARSRGQAPGLWALVVAVLGPVGLLFWLFAAGERRASAFVEVAGDLVPYVVGMVAALLAAVRVPAIGQTSSLQLLTFFGLPLVFGLILYQGSVLALATERGYMRTVWERLPTVLVSTNLALAGLLAIGAPLVKAYLNTCGFSTRTALTWWAIYVLGAAAGGLLLYGYHTWAVRQGFAAWSTLLLDTSGAAGATTVSSPPWRRLSFWVVLSFVALVTGIVLGALGSNAVEGLHWT